MSGDDRVMQRRAAGQWLREQRERAGYSSAAELGRAIGATKEVVWSYEAGRTSVPDERAEQIAGALRMDLIAVRRGLGLWVPAPDVELSGDALDDAMDDELARGLELLRRIREQGGAGEYSRVQRMLEAYAEDERETG